MQSQKRLKDKDARIYGRKFSSHCDTQVRIIQHRCPFPHPTHFGQRSIYIVHCLCTRLLPEDLHKNLVKFTSRTFSTNRNTRNRYEHLFPLSQQKTAIKYDSNEFKCNQQIRGLSNLGMRDDVYMYIETRIAIEGRQTKNRSQPNERTN